MGNSRSFKVGNIPYNKGTHLCSRKHSTRKGVQGFVKRPVLMIAQDGTIAREFESVAECMRVLGIKYSNSLAYAIKHNQLCAGHKLIYEDEFSPLADYRWRPTAGRNKNGTLAKGHKLGYLFYRRTSEECKQQKRIRSKATSTKLAADSNSRWGKGGSLIPILCVTTGKEYKSIKEAALSLGIPQYYISSAISRGGTTRGLKFRRI